MTSKATSKACDNLNKSVLAFRVRLQRLIPGTDAWMDVMTSSLSSTNAIHRMLSVREIGLQGDVSSIRTLREMLETENDLSVVGEIYSTLALLGVFHTLDDCLPLFQHQQIRRRLAAMQVTRHMPRQAAVSVLEVVLRNESDASLRRAAATMLARLRSTSGEEELLQYIDHENMFVKASAACALCLIGNGRGVTVLREILRRYEQFPEGDQKAIMFCIEGMLRYDGALQDDERSDSITATTKWLDAVTRRQ